MERFEKQLRLLNKDLREFKRWIVNILNIYYCQTQEGKTKNIRNKVKEQKNVLSLNNYITIYLGNYDL